VFYYGYFEDLRKIPRKFSDIFMEKFQPIPGKIPKNFSMLLLEYSVSPETDLPRR
jgi:hypothetical protein